MASESSPPSVPVSDADLRHTAALARIALDDAALAELAPSFRRILEAFRVLQDADSATGATGDTGATGECDAAGPPGEPAAWRPDDPLEDAERAARLLARAPAPVDGFYGVPHDPRGPA